MSPELEELIGKLNDTAQWVSMDAAERDYETMLQLVGTLVNKYRELTDSGRVSAARQVGGGAQSAMACFSEEKAAEGRNRSSPELLLEGLIAVAIAGGEPGGWTEMALLSMLCRSAEVIGADVDRLFQEASAYATIPALSGRIREFPRQERHLRYPDRFGYKERQSPEGVVYEHVVYSKKPTLWESLLGRQPAALTRAERAARVISSFKMWRDFNAPGT